MSRKILSVILSAAFLLSFSSTALGFTFPEPDWTALLNERIEMVTETEFDLYVEGAADSAPYYGAKLEPKSGVYIGSVAENSKPLEPVSAYLTYIYDMTQTDFYYPANAMINYYDKITLVGWTIEDMNKVDYNQVRATLDTIAAYNKPMLIRFANEMNCSQLGENPDKYIEVFRKVADMIHEYDNFAVVWSPLDIGGLDRPFEYFYPGDEYVDWVGVSSYDIMYFQGDNKAEYNSSLYFMTGEYSWAINKLKPFMEFLEKNNINKPVMISESGVATSNSYGDDCQSWASSRLRHMLWYLPMKYPQIKMINYFDTYRDNETEKFNISDYPYAVEIFNEAKSSGNYIKNYGDTAEFTFNPAAKAGVVNAKNDILPLYTLAYFPKQAEVTVNYYLDGNWVHSTSEIPYKCNLDISKLSDGNHHTVRIATEYGEKEYSLTKKGNSVSFEEKMVSLGEIPVTVNLNGSKVEFDQPPVIQEGRTLVPLRAIFEALGAYVNWNSETQTITSVKDGKSVSLTIGSNSLYVNGSEITLDVPAQLINGRTLVPARAVAESFNCKVSWNGGTRTVIITQ